MRPRRAGTRAAAQDRRRSDAGDTLLEVLLALIVLGVAALAIILAFTTSIIGSSEYRTLSTVDTVLRSAAESATSQIQQQPASAWTACSDTGAVVFNSTTGYTPPANYAVAISSVTYWDAASSAFVATCVPNAAQMIQVTATYKGVAYTISFVVDDPHARPVAPSGAATHLAFIGQPTTTPSGNPISPPPVVAIEDAQNNIVTTDLSQAAIAITPGSGPSGAALSSGCSGVEFYGVVTFSNCSITMTGSSYTLTATDGTLTSATSSAFAITPAPASQLVFSAAPSGSLSASSTAAGGPFKVQIQDLFGNPVAVAAPVTVTLSTSSLGTAGNTPFFSLASGGAASSAVATVTIPIGASTSSSFYYADTATGTPTLTGSSGSLLAATTTATISPGAASTLAYLTAPPATAMSNAQFSVAVAELDAFGNVESADSTTNVGLGAPNGSGFSCGRRGSRAQLSGGTVTFSNCSYSSSGGAYTLTASSGGLTSATASTTVLGPPSALVYTTAPPASTTTGATFPVVVTEQDASGNTEVGDSSTSVTLRANGAGFSCSTTPARVTNGVAAFGGCSYTVASGSAYTLTASSNGLAPATASTSVASTPSQLSFSTPPPSSTATGATFGVVVAEQDNVGNTMTNDSTTTVSLSVSNGGGGFSCTGAPSHVTSGVASFTGCSYAVASASGFTMRASSGSLSPATATTVVAGAATRLALTTSPPAATTAGSTFSVVVAEQDALGTTETTDSSTALSLLASNGSGFSCATTPTHLSNGVATYQGCRYTVASASAYTLTASAPPLASASATTTVSAGTPTKLVYTTAPPAAVAAGSTFGVVVAEQDAFGNVASGDSTTSLSLTANNGGGGLSCSLSPAHVTSGVAAFAGCSFSSTRGSPYTLSATSGSLTPATAAMAVTHGAPDHLAFTTPAQTFEKGAAAGTTGSGTITVQAEDAGGNPVPAPSGGYAVTLTSSAGSGTFTPSTLTIVAGTSSASFTYHDTSSGTVTLTAKDAALPSPTATQTATVLGSAGSAAVSASSQAPNPVVAGSTATYTVTVTNNQLFSTHDFAITSVGGLPLGATSAVTSATCVTISDFFFGNTGTFTLAVPTSVISPDSTSSLALVATAFGSTNGSCTGGTSSTAQGQGTLVVSAPTTQLAFSQQPTTTAHGATISPPVTVLVLDANGDVVAGSTATVTLAIANNPGGAALSGTLSVNAVNGVATFNTLKLSSPGAGDTLAATGSGLLTTTSGAFNVT